MFPLIGSPVRGSRWMFSAETIWLERIDNNSVILGNTVTDYGSGLGYVTDILPAPMDHFDSTPACGLKPRFDSTIRIRSS